MDTATCPICAGAMKPAGTRRSAWSKQQFSLEQCQRCHFARISNPRTDFEQLYDEAYYRGHGADPLVDYVAEMQDADTIRRLEWQGIERVVASITNAGPDVRWLDLGCGLGGLVRHLQDRGFRHVVGFDEGFGADWGRSHGLPILERAQLDERTACFDVITAIEVVEHITDPVEFFRDVERLLAPGGIVFLTTGNVEAVRGPIADWSYVIPDVHVEFFGPTSLDLALRTAGLTTEHPGFRPGHEQIVRYKVLKNLRRKRIAAWQRLIPWKATGQIVDKRYGVTALPIGRKAHLIEEAAASS